MKADAPGASERPPLLAVEELRVRFEHDRRLVPAVDGLSYRLERGRTLAIIGESGSGKTVSCRALLGLLPPTATLSGSVRLNGKELLGLSEPELRRHRGADISIVFQDPARSLNPTMRVGQQITEALRQHTPLDHAAARTRAVELLDLLRVPAAGHRFLSYPHELSGGMCQRVMIAIALAGQPEVLIADEATRSLDSITQADTLDLLKEMQQEFGMALIVVSHDLRLAFSCADHVLVMYAGRAVEYASSKELLRAPRMRYTQALLEAIPGFNARSGRFPVTPGHPPDLASLPEGCAFEPRCSSAHSICKKVRPPLEEQRRDHWCACWYPRIEPGALS